MRYFILIFISLCLAACAPKVTRSLTSAPIQSRWECHFKYDGTSEQAKKMHYFTLLLLEDGTSEMHFKMPNGSTFAPGTWETSNDTLQWKFTKVPTVYTAKISGDSLIGSFNTFSKTQEITTGKWWGKRSTNFNDPIPLK